MTTYHFNNNNRQALSDCKYFLYHALDVNNENETFVNVSLQEV